MPPHSPGSSTEITPARSALLCAALICSCSLDTHPTRASATRTEPIRIRDAGSRFVPDLALDSSGSDAGAQGEPGSDAGGRPEPEPEASEPEVEPQSEPGLEPEAQIERCGSNPCSNGARCEPRGAGFECLCQAGYQGALCDQQCGDGARTGSEVCDDGSDNGSPGHCDLNCTRLVEELALLSPQRGEVIDNPIFFDWELRGRNPNTRYCSMLMTDRDPSPEDRRGEQAFYVGAESEAIVTLSARRYRGPFSFAVITVACDDPAASCPALPCTSGSVCALPCEGRSIVSESRRVRAVLP